MRISSKILWAAFLLPLIWSCGEIDPPTIIPQTPSSILSTSAIVLTEEDAEELIAFEVSPADFGIPTGVNYTIQVDRVGNNFANPVDLESDPSTGTTVLVEVAELNSRAVAKGLIPGEPGDLEFRAKATPVRSVPELIGAVVTIPVTTYADAIRNLFLVGEATAPGWEPDNNNPPLFRDADNPDLYIYTGFFNAGGFKVLEIIGEWQPQYGTNDGTTVAVNEGGGSDPETFNIPTAGFYTFTLNLENNTFSIEAYTGDTTVQYASIGIIGDSTPGEWASSTPMTSRQFGGDHIWFISQTVVAGEIKFRANDSWDVNWGSDTPISGQAVLGSPDNIPIEAGTYKIWFNSLDGRYLFISE